MEKYVKTFGEFINEGFFSGDKEVANIFKDQKVLDSWTKEFKDFVESNKITVTLKNIEVRKDKAIWGAGVQHYRFLLKKDGKTFLTSEYSQGSGIKTEPDVFDILYAVIRDAQNFEQTRSFKDFCDSLGYKSMNDRAKANKIYKACEKEYNALDDAGLYNSIPQELEK